jgi:DNA-binding NtrC family response regulator
MSAGKERILIVDDDLAFRVGTVALLEDSGLSTSVAENGEAAKSLLAERQFDLVLSDLVMPGINGIELLQHIRASRPELPVIMVTGFASIDTAVQAMRLGARDYVTKPCANDELLLKIRRALDENSVRRELSQLRDEVRRVHSFGNIVGGHARMKEVYDLVRLVAGTDVPALILGETGTGKELVARAIHYNSSRRDRPFVVVNCSVMAETLLESELFGHEKGAFTGAHQLRIGKFEEAEGGTVFLDELGDVPLQIQTKLLRVLQEQEIQRVGGNETLKVNNRIVAATHRDLQAMIGSGSFREDLFYRLNVFPIMLPPLRERLEDIPALAEHFVKKHLGLSQGRVTNISPTVFPAMLNYPWKGNIRELENLIKRAIIKTPGDTIAAVDIPGAAEPAASVQRQPEGPAGSGVSFKEYLSSITRHAEETYLRRMLEAHKGNINQIAKLMEIDRKTVYRKMADYQIEPGEFRMKEEKNSQL